MGPEAEVERPVVKLAKEQGWTVRKLTFLGTRGAPDRMFGKQGRTVLIEFKSEDGELRKQQERRHRELREDFGLEVHVCSSVEAACAVLGLE